MSNPCYDKGDYCLRTSLYIVGKILQNKLTEQDERWMREMIVECRLDKWFGHRKSKEYRWSNSGSEIPSQNTLLNRPTKWIYDHILKYFKCDPYKGLNGDQYRAYFIWLYLNRDTLGALKVIFGFLIRGGLTPSLCEWMPVRLQSYVMLFKVHWLFYPFYLVSLLFFILSRDKNYDKPIEGNATNKISLLPTAKLLGYKLPDKSYVRRVYDEYFRPRTSCYFIGDSIRRGLIGE